jgi:hypothetical protein
MSRSYKSSLENSFDETQSYTTFETATAHLQKKLIRMEKDQRFQYQLISLLFNLIAIMQIMVGAAITALGPTGGKHVLAITILGAVNTSVAGLLALLKGRGLPERLRRNSIELAQVSDLIRERATLLRYGNSHVYNDGISHLLQEVFTAYASAKQIIERNQPDTYAGGSMSHASADVTMMNNSPSQTAVTSKPSGKRRQIDEEMGTANVAL